MRLGNPHLAVDTKLQNEGAWVDCPSMWWSDKNNPMSICVRSVTNRDYILLLRQLTKDLTPDEIEDKSFEIGVELAKNVLVNWRNHFDIDGNVIHFDLEIAAKVLSNPDNKRYLDFVLLSSRTQTNFDAKAKEKEEVEKN